MSTSTAPQIESKPLSRKERSIASLYRRMLKAQARASTEYELADRLKLQIAKKLGGHGRTGRITTEGRGIEVVDPMKAAAAKADEGEMPKVFGHGAVRLYELKEVNLFVK